MRRGLAILAATAVAITLSACGGEDDGEAAVAAATTSAPSTTTAPPSSAASTAPTSVSSTAPTLVPAPAGREAFVVFLEDRGVIPQYGSEDDTVDLGLAVCTRFDAGGTQADVMAILNSGSMSADQATSVVAAAIVAFCPQHANKLGS
jgi:hypothetical protein